MPARKPSTLNTRNDTKADRLKREAVESAMTPVTQLSSKRPLLLQKHKHASAIWKRLIGLYSEVEGTIATAFDEDLLTKYCILEEECIWLDGKRAEVDKNAKRLNKLLENKARLKEVDAEKYLGLLQQYSALNARVQGFDARLDGKRKLLHSLAQSLYLTPRSRAGVAPPEKPPKKPKSAMGGLLDED